MLLMLDKLDLPLNRHQQLLILQPVIKLLSQLLTLLIVNIYSESSLGSEDTKVLKVVWPSRIGRPRVA